MWLVGGAAATLAHCTLSHNSCNGAACWDAGGTAALRSCTLVGNKLNGLRVLHGARAALQSCEVADNTEHGIEVGHAAALDARDCTVVGAHPSRHHAAPPARGRAGADAWPWLQGPRAR